MSEELQQKLRAQLWEVANNLRGNMSANEFMYFSLGFIFYKYLSEKIENYADRALEKMTKSLSNSCGSQAKKMPLNFKRKSRSSVWKISVIL